MTAPAEACVESEADNLCGRNVWTAVWRWRRNSLAELYSPYDPLVPLQEVFHTQPGEQ